MLLSVEAPGGHSLSCLLKVDFLSAVFISDISGALMEVGFYNVIEINCSDRTVKMSHHYDLPVLSCPHKIEGTVSAVSSLLTFRF